VLRGSSIIVEIQPPEEIKTSGGLIVATVDAHAKGQSVNAHRVEVGKVLMTGPGYYVGDEEGGAKGEYEALEVTPGAIVVMPQHSYSLMSHFPGITRPTKNRLALVKMDSILAYYPTQEAYEKAKEVLNKAL
jgi:hypothetical protein